MKNRVRFTWIILLFSFSACMLLSLTIPFGANAFVQQSTRRLFVWGRGWQGRPSTTLGGELLLPENAPIRYRTPIGMDAGAGERGFFEVTHPDSDVLLARVEVVGTASVMVNEATMPRFGRSSAENKITIGLSEGSIQLTVPSDAAEQTVYVNTPNGQTAIDAPGKYTVSFDGQKQKMQVSVYEGHAWLRADDGSDQLQLQSEERGELGVDRRTTGPFDTERNLIRNGDFSGGYTEWRVESGRLEIASEDEPKQDIEIVNGEEALRFSRDAEGNASSSVRQTINESLSLYTDMRLKVTLRIINQSLDVCGVQGTECPLTIRLSLRDADGQPFEWAQGYYVRGEITEGTPDACQICGFPLSLSVHQRLAQANEVYTIGSEINLIESLGNVDSRPDYIDSMRIVAEGHSFAVDVLAVELLVSEETIETTPISTAIEQK